MMAAGGLAPAGAEAALLSAALDRASWWVMTASASATPPALQILRAHDARVVNDDIQARIFLC